MRGHAPRRRRVVVKKERRPDPGGGHRAAAHPHADDGRRGRRRRQDRHARSRRRRCTTSTSPTCSARSRRAAVRHAAAVPEPRLRAGGGRRRAGRRRAPATTSTSSTWRSTTTTAIDKGFRPQMAAFHLQTEPWLFTFDTHGQGRRADRGRVQRARAEGGDREGDRLAGRRLVAPGVLLLRPLDDDLLGVGLRRPAARGGHAEPQLQRDLLLLAQGLLERALALLAQLQPDARGLVRGREGGDLATRLRPLARALCLRQLGLGRDRQALSQLAITSRMPFFSSFLETTRNLTTGPCRSGRRRHRLRRRRRPDPARWPSTSSARSAPSRRRRCRHPSGSAGCRRRGATL